MTEPYELVARFRPITNYLQPLLPGMIIRCLMSWQDFHAAENVFEAPYGIWVYQPTGEPVSLFVASQRIENDGDITSLIDNVREESHLRELEESE